MEQEQTELSSASRSLIGASKGGPKAEVMLKGSWLQDVAADLKRVSEQEQRQTIAVAAGCDCGFARIEVPDFIDSGTTLDCLNCGKPIVFDADTPDSRAATFNRLSEQAEALRKAREALEAIAEVHEDPCRHDHHGLCQEHHLRRVERDGEWVPECEMELVRDALQALNQQGYDQ